MLPAAKETNPAATAYGDRWDARAASTSSVSAASGVQRRSATRTPSARCSMRARLIPGSAELPKLILLCESHTPLPRSRYRTARYGPFAMVEYPPAARLCDYRDGV